MSRSYIITWIDFKGCDRWIFHDTYADANADFANVLSDVGNDRVSISIIVKSTDYDRHPLVDQNEIIEHEVANATYAKLTNT